MKHIKSISIDQLKLGMFIVGMDQPWYRTPFLLHKRLILQTKDIDLLRQHGIREVKIDVDLGLDVGPAPSGGPPPSSDRQETPATPPSSDAAQPASPEQPLEAAPAI